MSARRNYAILCVLQVLIFAGWTIGQSPPDRGHRILLEKGLQIQANVYPYAYSFDLARWASSNFTATMFETCDYAETYLGPAPGVTQWGRVHNSDPFTITEGEMPYLSNLVRMQYKDEQDLTDPAELTAATDWLAQTRTLYPSVLGHTTQAGQPFTAGQMRAYMQQAHPDILMFDRYAFVQVGSPAGGSPTLLYQEMAFYRTLGLEGNDGTGTTPIPYGLFFQAYKETAGGQRFPSDSELRLNEFAAWTFGYKLACAWLYNKPSSESPFDAAFFDGVGDYTPTDLFYRIAETNRQSLNLGKTLIRLLSTDVRFIAGQHWNQGVLVDNTLPSGMNTWVAGAGGDSFITTISATNLGTLNSGLKGDVLVGHFKPLMETDDGPNFSNEMYFMITNGLSNAEGLVSETRQRIRIDFNFRASGITQLQRLSRDNGTVEDVSLISDGGTQYHLDLEIDGGTGDLFKYKTAAPFITGHQIIFQDNFETNTSYSTAAYPDDSGDYDPTGWTSVEEGLSRGVQVTNYSSPGAIEGSLYLRTHREGANIAQIKQDLNFTLPADDLHVQAALYMPAAYWIGAAFGFYDASNPSVQAGLYAGNMSGDHWYYDNGTQWVDTGVPVTKGAWQTVAVQLTKPASATGVLDGTFDFYVNGVKKAGGLAHGVKNIRWIYMSSDQEALWDNVLVDTGSVPPSQGCFRDSFETNTSYSTTAYPDDSGDYDPTGWGFIDEGLPRNVQVSNYGAPGAYDGSLYLRTSHASGDTALARRDLAVAYAAENIYMETGLYQDSSSWLGAAFGFYDASNQSVKVDLCAGNWSGADHWYYNDGTQWIDTGVSVIKDAWYKVAIQLTKSASITGVRDGTFDFYVNGFRRATGLPHGVKYVRLVYLSSDQQACWDNVTVDLGSVDTGPPPGSFYDNFETNTSYSTAAYPDDSGDYDPTGWTSVEEGLSRGVQVANYSPPGAYEGQLYLRMHREGGNVAWIIGDLGLLFPAEGYHMETELYLPGTYGLGASFGFTDINDMNVRTYIYAGNFNGEGWYYHNGTQWINTGAPLTKNAWHRVAVVLTKPASATGTLDGTYDFYIDGVKKAGGLPHGIKNTRWIYLSSDQEALWDNVSVDTGVVAPPAPSLLVTLQGTVIPTGYTGDKRNVGVKVELQQGGSPVRTEWMVLQADGSFAIPDVTPGIYDIAVKADCWLQKVITGTTVAVNPTDIGTVTLTSGDNDGDNLVMPADLSIVLTNMDIRGDP